MKLMRKHSTHIKFFLETYIVIANFVTKHADLFSKFTIFIIFQTINELFILAKLLIKFTLILIVIKITLVYIKIHKTHHKDNRAKKFFCG